nr:cytochrome c [candidate division Zixibacteria bacterium]
MIGLIHKVFLPLAIQVPVPRDLELNLPLGDYELKILLVVLFLAHILFVNMMVGGSVFSVIFEIIGLTNRKYDALARKIAETITVNKSLAVVLGVGPLLCINLVYTTHFYSANAITGYAWISIIPLVTLAFLLAYIHKYMWDKWREKNKRLHLLVGSFAAILFLSIPFIFLANINLMLFPEKWPEAAGFFSSLRIGNVFPRYFHFLAASLALTGLFLAGWFGRKGFDVEKFLPEFTRPQLRRLFYRAAFYITLAQLLFGPLLLFTLPYDGISMIMIMVILTGVIIALVVLYILSREIRNDNIRVGHHYLLIWGFFGLVVLAMGTGRHIYRETCLNDHKQLMADETARFRAIETATRMSIEAGYGAGEAVGGGMTGEKVFRNCAACHAVDKVLAAPSLREVYSIYKGNPEGIVKWASNPGKKRPEFAPMPSFAHLGEEQLEMVAEYILQIGAEDNSETVVKQPISDTTSDKK